MASLIALLGGVRAAIFAGLCVALLATVGVQTFRLSRSADKADKAVLYQRAAERERDSAIAANNDNLKTIAQLRTANQEWAATAAARNQQAAAAVAAVTSERDALAAELSERRKDRGRFYHEDQDAAAWGRTAVPARLVDQLRH